MAGSKACDSNSGRSPLRGCGRRPQPTLQPIEAGHPPLRALCQTILLGALREGWAEPQVWAAAVPGGWGPQLGAAPAWAQYCRPGGANTGLLKGKSLSGLLLQGNQGAGLDTNGDRKQPTQTKTANEPGPTRPPATAPCMGRAGCLDMCGGRGGFQYWAARGIAHGKGRARAVACASRRVCGGVRVCVCVFDFDNRLVFGAAVLRLLKMKEAGRRWGRLAATGGPHGLDIRPGAAATGEWSRQAFRGRLRRRAAHMVWTSDPVQQRGKGNGGKRNTAGLLEGCQGGTHTHTHAHQGTHGSSRRATAHDGSCHRQCPPQPKGMGGQPRERCCVGRLSAHKQCTAVPGKSAPGRDKRVPKRHNTRSGHGKHAR